MAPAKKTAPRGEFENINEVNAENDYELFPEESGNPEELKEQNIADVEQESLITDNVQALRKVPVILVAGASFCTHGHKFLKNKEAYVTEELAEKLLKTKFFERG